MLESRSTDYLFRFSVGRAVRTSMCSPGTGESEARLRLASRTGVRCHILWQIVRESRTTGPDRPLETRPVDRQALLARQRRGGSRNPGFRRLSLDCAVVFFSSRLLLVGISRFRLPLLLLISVCPSSSAFPVRASIGISS